MTPEFGAQSLDATHDPRSIARVVIDAVHDDRVIVRLPGTDYRLDFRVANAKPASLEPGKRARGTIEAVALKIHAATGGGQFIEPVDGTPRIVAGRVLHVDQSTGRVLVDVSVPMWVTTVVAEDLNQCREGELVNFYVESDSTFSPVSN